MKIHLDTDLGTNPDDACALAMLLGWPGVELCGITTNLDAAGRRAGMALELLQRAGRRDIPVVAGAGASLTTFHPFEPDPDDERYWGRAIAAAPSPPGAALDLLQRSIDAGALIVAIGAYTNLALLEICRPKTLQDVEVVAMGGFFEPPAKGLPSFGAQRDTNVQHDPRAAQLLAAAARLTLVPLSMTMQVTLRTSDLPRLRTSGPLGELLARQNLAYAEDTHKSQLASAHPGLPADLLNFHHDPVTCAVALGWSGAVVQEQSLKPVFDNAALRFEVDAQGRATRVVTHLDAEAFSEIWLSSIEVADRLACTKSPP